MNKNRLKKIIKHNRLVMFLYRHTLSFFFRFIGLFLRTKKIILFSSYGGEKFNDSPRVLFDAIKSNIFFKEYKLIWALENKINIDGADVIKIDSFRYFIVALQSRVWITNVNIERGLNFKKKNTIYLNTWHGTGPKKTGNAIKNRKDYNFSNVDILCVDGDYSEWVFLKYFKAKKENFLRCGRPREDALFDFRNFKSNEIKEKIGVNKEKKIILYAPTWRDGTSFSFDMVLWNKLLSEKNYIVLIRSHHFADLIKIDDEFSSVFIDVSKYEEINDLYFISDILISDYSSAFFDYGLLGKPFYCFANDLDEYLATTGLFMDIKNLFYPKVFENDFELLDYILNCDLNEDSKECSKIIHSVINREPNATNKCISRLIDLLNKANNKN